MKKDTTNGKMKSKSRLKKRIYAIVSIVIAVILLLSATLLSLFKYANFGPFPMLREMWICSAMHTYTHQYLATWIFSEAEINEVLQRNAISDEGHDSDDISKDFSVALSPTGDIILDMDSVYESEGYEKVSEGIFLKTVEGKSGSSPWVGYVMMISDPTRIRLVDTAYQFDRGDTVMNMVASVGGVAGINGGGFNDGPNYDSNGGEPTGILIEEGKLVNPTLSDTYNYNLIGFNSKGKFILKHATAGWAMSNDIQNAVSFKPYIVVNGQGMVKEGSTGGWGIAPRTGIGQRQTGEVIFIAIDGRQVGYSIGSDLDGLQQIMLAEGCYNGAMMDGGSSTAMVLDGEYVNKPSLGHERWINNAWVVMPVEEATEK